MPLNNFLKQKLPHVWISGTYLVISIIWITFSDRLVFLMFEDHPALHMINTYKGWVFVTATSLLLFFLVRFAIKVISQTQLNLEKTSAFQKHLLENHHLPVWQSDKEGKCIFTNKAWSREIGHKTNTSQIFPWLQNIHPEDRDACFERYSSATIHHKPFSSEYRIMFANGNYHWVYNSCIPSFNTQGKFIGYIDFLIDINDKKLLEEKYRDSSRRYGYLFSNNPSPMLVCDMQDLRVLEINKAAINQYGYTEKEFLKLNMLDLRPKEEIPYFMEHLSGKLPDYNRSSGWVHKRKDGSTFDAEVISHSLPMPNMRNTRLIIVNNITEQIETFKKLKEGERRFRMLFLNAPDGVFILSEKLKVLDINPKACKLLGLRCESLGVMSPFQFIDNEHSYQFNSAIQKLNRGESAMGSTNFKSTCGRVFRTDWYAISFKEDTEKRYFFSFKDVDANYKMQEALKQSERMNATLVSNLPGMAYRCKNNKHWPMLFLSDGVEELTGYPKHEFLGKKPGVQFGSLVHKEDANRVWSEAQDGLQSMKPYEITYRICDKNNKIKWVWEHAQGVYKDNELQYIEGFLMDVTREKESLSRAEFQSHLLSLIIDNIPFPLFYKDKEGKYTGCNKSFAELLGREKDEIINHTVYDIFESEQADVFYEKDQELFIFGGRQTYETEINFPSGRKMNVVFHKSVLFDLDGESMGIIGVYFDITDRVKAETIIKKQLEELSRINSELESFTYTVSHDLRSPLVTIRGFLGMLKEDMNENNSEQVQEDIMRIDDATIKMQQLLEDLLKLSRVGKLVNPFQKISFNKIANETKELLHGLLKEKDCELIIQENMPEIFADKARIREVLQNIIENAIKFTPAGKKPEIKIYVREISENAEFVFCVEDNGIGINPDYKEKIFGLFNKLDNKTPGTGIGLSLVKRIIEKHKGGVWVESAGINKGCTFCFTLNTEDKTN